MFSALLFNAVILSEAGAHATGEVEGPTKVLMVTMLHQGVLPIPQSRASGTAALIPIHKGGAGIHACDDAAEENRLEPLRNGLV